MDIFVVDSFGFMKPNLKYVRGGLPEKLRHSGVLPPYFFENAVTDRYINSDGFKTHEFSEIRSSHKKKVMLIGDSYVFGISIDRRIKTTFPEWMEKIDTNLITINLGLPGTDVATYRKVALTYIPLLKPDYVIVNLYLNDFILYKKEIIPYQFNDLFITNSAPFLKTNADNPDTSKIWQFNTMFDAYNFVIRKFTLFDNNSLPALVSKHSALLSGLYRIIRGFGNPKVNQTGYAKVDYTIKYLRDIKRMADSCNARFILTCIPKFDSTAAIPDIGNISVNQYFPADLDFQYQAQFPESDFMPSPDGHFNEEGNLKYANNLLNIIKNRNN
jgi:hypothetical protein